MRQVCKYLCAVHNISSDFPILRFLLRPENRLILVEQIESSSRFDIIPIMAAELASMGEEDTSYDMLVEIFPKQGAGRSDYYEKMFNGLEKENIPGKAQTILANSVIKYWNSNTNGSTAKSGDELFSLILGIADYLLLIFLLNPSSYLGNHLELFAWFAFLNVGYALVSYSVRLDTIKEG